VSPAVEQKDLMFCFQCEQTAKSTGCTKRGVCGKDAATAALQDLLLYTAKGLAIYAHRARELRATDRDINVFPIKALFSTVTNVNFNPERLHDLMKSTLAYGDLMPANGTAPPSVTF